MTKPNASVKKRNRMSRDAQIEFLANHIEFLEGQQSALIKATQSVGFFMGCMAKMVDEQVADLLKGLDLVEENCAVCGCAFTALDMVRHRRDPHCGCKH